MHSRPSNRTTIANTVTRHVADRFGLNKRLAFFLGFVRHPDLVGSVVPSSRFLARRIAALAGVRKAHLVVELGPGTGSTTQAILAALPAASRLLAIEIDPRFVSLLGSDPDPRLIVHPGNALHIQETLSHYGFSQADIVISGIPFSTMPQALGRRILRAAWSCLAPGGRFVAYQLRDRVAFLGRDLLGTPKTEVEFLNVPPMRLYRWRKPLNGTRVDTDFMQES
jgi:phosphatidylethanolamine/phosphatidyl-N-methylethanolamine N-methyltransferase